MENNNIEETIDGTIEVFSSGMFSISTKLSNGTAIDWDCELVEHNETNQRGIKVKCCNLGETVIITDLIEARVELTCLMKEVCGHKITPVIIETFKELISAVWCRYDGIAGMERAVTEQLEKGSRKTISDPDVYEL